MPNDFLCAAVENHEGTQCDDLHTGGQGKHQQLLIGKIALIKKPGKSRDRDNGRLKLVGEVVDEVAPQHLGLFKLLGKLIEAVLYLYDYLVIG